MTKKSLLWTIIIISLSAGGIAAQPYSGPDTLWTWTSQRYNQVVRDLLWMPDETIWVGGDYWNQTSFDLCISKLNSFGGETNFYVYGNPSYDEWMGFLTRLSENEVSLTGQMDSDNLDPDPCRVFYLDTMGTVIQNVDITYPDRNLDVWATTCAPDGGLFIAGAIANYSQEPFIIKMNADRDTVWTRRILEIRNVFGMGIRATSDGGCVITAGESPMEVNPMEQVLLMKIDSAGSVEFMREYGGERRDLGRDIDVMPDGGYIIAGETMPEDTLHPWAGLLIRTDSQGDTLWTRIFDDYVDEQLMRVVVLPDGGFVVAGYAAAGQAFLHLIRYSAEEELLWSRYYPAGNNWFFRCGLAVDDQNRYILACTKNITRAYVVVTEPDSALTTIPRHSTVLPDGYSLAVFPNPFNAITEITFILPSTQRVSLRLYDVLGREVAVLVNETKTAGEHRVTFDAAGLASGVYLCRMEAGKFAQTRKVVLIR